MEDGGVFSADESGRNIRYGVREHAMGGIANGIAYHGGLIPFVSTFLPFSDYMRGSVRLAALSGLRVVYVWTHDSVGVGEDGPTHQPVEHYAALRAIPNLTFVRPGDANESSAAWALALENRRRPDCPGVHPSEAAGPAGHGRIGAGWRSRWCLRVGRRGQSRWQRDRARADAARHRLRAAPGHGRAGDR